MLYREIFAVCSHIHTKHINTLCVQNVELLNVKLAVHIVTTGLQSVNGRHQIYKLSIVWSSIEIQMVVVSSSNSNSCSTVNLVILA